MVARAPHIGLPLLAGRLTVKKALFNQVSSIQHSAKKAGDRVASRLAVKELVRRSSTLLGEAADNVQHDLARWAPPKAADAALPVNAGCLPQVRPPPVRQACRQWCGHYHPQLVKAMCLGNPLVAYCLKADGVFQNKAWLCLNRIRKVRCLIDCTISLEGGQPKCLRVSEPFATTTSTSLIEGVHEGLIAKGGLDSTRFVDSVEDLGADADADASEPIVEIFSLPLTWGFDDSQASEGGIIAHVSVDSGAAVLELRSQLPFGAAKRANAGAAIPVVHT